MTTMNRRRAITGAAAVGLGGPLLAACGSDETDPPAGTAADPATGAASSDASGEPSADESQPVESETTTEELATAADVPEGGGTVFEDQQVVVTQPTAGEFKCFAAMCTHQGCLVTDVTDTINCSCHGSQFSVTDGSVVTGPATAPLPEQQINVDGDSISLA